MPWLEVLASPPGGPPPGTRFELPRVPTPFVIGEAPTLPVSLPGVGLGPRQVRLERVGKTWSVVPFKMEPGTWLDGQRLLPNTATKLTHGAVLELGDAQLVLTWCERGQGALPRSLSLEAALADAGADEAPWLVYADFLQEHGDPWGAELARRTQGPTPARRQALGPLARAWVERWVSLHFNAFGAVQGVRFRPPAVETDVRPRACALVAALGASKAARTLSWLDLGVLMDTRHRPWGEAQEPLEARVLPLLEALLRAEPLLGLHRLVLGYASAPIDLGPWAPTLARLGARHPGLAAPTSVTVANHEALTVEVRAVAPALSLRLAPGHAWLVRESGPAVRALGPGATLHLDQSRRCSIGSDLSHALWLRAADGGPGPEGALGLHYLDGAWRLYSRGFDGYGRALPETRINGEDLSRGDVLLAGDEVSFGPGVTLRVAG